MSPLSYRQAAEILLRLRGHESEFVLIGGQALNFWAEQYSDRAPSLQAFGPYTSKDIDFCGQRDVVMTCASLLGGQSSFPVQPVRTEVIGKILFPMGAGDEMEIDVLRNPYGLPAEEVDRMAIPVTTVDKAGNDVTFRVMHPVHCMESRVANVLGLPEQYNNPHGLQQMRASVVCAAEFLRELLDQGERRAVLNLNERIFRFATENDYGIRAPEFGAHPFEAVLVDPRLDEFCTKRYPQMRAIAEERQRRG